MSPDSSSHATKAVLLVAHGTVEDLKDMTAFVTNIRRGHPPPPALIAELVHRYTAIGGRSPLLDHTRSLAQKVEAKLGVPVRVGMRLWKPFAKDVLKALVEEGVRDVVVVPLAQFSSKVYGDAVRADMKALAEAGLPEASIQVVADWGLDPGLVSLAAASVKRALAALTPEVRAKAVVLYSAHSLPMMIIRGGDAYETEFRASVEAIAREVGADEMARGVPHRVAFQSQGASTGPGGKPMEWLGPDLESTLPALAKEGFGHVVFAPVGFLADHVEILFDLDIEAAGWAKEVGLSWSRIDSPNDSAAMTAAVAGLAAALLGDGRLPP